MAAKWMTPARPTGLYEAQLRSGMAETVHPYQPYTPLERLLLGTLRSTQEPPRYFYELLEFRR
jgi:hypothetical protein